MATTATGEAVSQMRIVGTDAHFDAEVHRETSAAGDGETTTKPSDFYCHL
jgi:hypothetical protein